MGECEDEDTYFRKIGEVIVVQPKLSPEKEDQIKKSIKQKRYFGGTTGTLLITLIAPVAVYYLHFSCYKESCGIGSWFAVEWEKEKLLTAFGYYALVAMGILFGSNLPIGPIKISEPMLNGDTERHRLIGYKYLVGILPFLILGFAPFFTEGNVSWSNFRFYHITIDLHYYILAAIILSFSMSVWLYKRSLKLSISTINMHANTGSAIYDFFMGRQISPRVFGVMNIKSFVILMSFACTVIIEAGYTTQIMSENNFYTSPTLLIMFYSKCLWALDYLHFEENYLTTQTVKHDGCGFWFVFSKLVLFPFLMTFPERFTVINRYEITSEPFMIIVFVFITACAIWHRYAHADKGLFTRYKDHPEVLAYDCILAPNGKRLLVDGWWSGCRHPTYLCAIFSALACASVTGFSGLLPYSFVAFQLIHLLHRIQRNEDLCRFEYGEAWDLYCQKVPHKLLRFIY